MNDLFKKLGFHKMDEMEQNIALRAQRNALLYVLLALMGWSFYESYQVYTQHRAIDSAPSFLLITTVLVLIFSQLFLQRRAVKDDEEYTKAHPLMKGILAVVIIGGLIASLGALLILVRQ